jgi:hypothetical protein
MAFSTMIFLITSARQMISWFCIFGDVYVAFLAELFQKGSQKTIIFSFPLDKEVKVAAVFLFSFVAPAFSQWNA